MIFRSDEWPNLSALEAPADTMFTPATEMPNMDRKLDQDTVLRFPDGEPVSGITSTKDEAPIIGAHGVAFLLVVALIVVLLSILGSKAGAAEIPGVSPALDEVKPTEGLVTALVSFRNNGTERCHITPDLKVHGVDRAPCLEHMETALRLAKAEALVNRKRRR